MSTPASATPRGVRPVKGPVTVTAHNDREEEPANEGDVRRMLNFALVDLGMIVVALASLVIVVIDELHLYPQEYRPLVVWIDLAIVILFATEFVWRVVKETHRARFVARSWFDLLGMFPLILLDYLHTIPQLAFLRIFRLARVIRIGAVVSRLARAYNTIVGERAAQLLFKKYSKALIEEITDRVTIQMIEQFERSIVNTRYAEAIGATLETREADVRKVVRETIERAGVPKALVNLPGAAGAIDRYTTQVTLSVAATLKSDEVNRMVSESLLNVLTSFKEEVKKKDWTELPAAPAPAS